MDKEQKPFRPKRKKKVCAFCAEKIEVIDYKDAGRLRKFISERAKILPRRVCEFVVLMTWAALKGGLSLALAMGTKEYLSPEIYNVFINVTYISIFFTVLVQGLTVGKAYMALEKHKLGRQQKLK